MRKPWLVASTLTLAPAFTAHVEPASPADPAPCTTSLIWSELFETPLCSAASTPQALAGERGSN
jgi:hypothetical protein